MSTASFDSIDLEMATIMHKVYGDYLWFFKVYVAGGFWAVIPSRAAWKRSWAGCDPTHSIIVADRSVAITGNMVRV